MTYEPERLDEWQRYMMSVTGLPAVSLGTVGSAGHHTAGTSYHIGWSSLRTDAYSRQHSRDTKLRTDAASASDTGYGTARFGHGDLVRLTKWAVAEARAGRRPDTREIIGPWGDGRAYRFDALDGWEAELRARGDSHETHMHESWWRDSEHRDKTRYYRPFFEGTTNEEGDDVGWDDRLTVPGWFEDQFPGNFAEGEGTARLFLTAGYGYSRMVHRQAQDLAAGQAAILAAVAGEDVPATVRAELDRHRAALLAELGDDLADRVAARLTQVPAETVREAVRAELGTLRLVADPAGDGD